MALGHGGGTTSGLQRHSEDVATAPRFVELGGQLPGSQAQLADGVSELGLGRAPRARVDLNVAGEHASAASRLFGVAHDPRVAGKLGPVRTAKRRPACGVAADEHGLLELADGDLDVLSRLRRRLAVARIANTE